MQYGEAGKNIYCLRSISSNPFKLEENISTVSDNILKFATLLEKAGTEDL